MQQLTLDEYRNKATFNIDELETTLKKLKKMRDEVLITEGKYTKLKNSIINKLK